MAQVERELEELGKRHAALRGPPDACRLVRLDGVLTCPEILDWKRGEFQGIASEHDPKQKGPPWVARKKDCFGCGGGI